MNDFVVGLITKHPKTSVIGAFGLGLGLVPLLKTVGWFF